MDHHALVCVLNRRTDLSEEPKARAGVQPELVAVLRDRLTVNELHHQIGDALLRGPAIEQSRNVGVGEARQDLPFRAQPVGNEGRLLAGAHQLDCDLLLVLLVDAGGAVHLSHAAGSDLGKHLVGTESPANESTVSCRHLNRGGRRSVEEPLASHLVRCQQRFNFRAQGWVSSAHPVEARCTRLAGERHGLIQGALDLLPPLGRHAEGECCISR